MIRITRQADYGLVLMSRMASQADHPLHTARDLAGEAHLSMPMVSKILKLLARKGLLVSHRGVKGGYTLAHDPGKITINQIITAIEGPIAITTCSVEKPGSCNQEPVCPVRTNWQKINQAVRSALDQITLSEMAQPLPAAFARFVDPRDLQGAGA
jgi:FeS assembly SUF system regulator